MAAGTTLTFQLLPSLNVLVLLALSHILRKRRLNPPCLRLTRSTLPRSFSSAVTPYTDVQHLIPYLCGPPSGFPIVVLEGYSRISAVGQGRRNWPTALRPLFIPQRYACLSGILMTIFKVPPQYGLLSVVVATASHFRRVQYYREVERMPNLQSGWVRIWE